MTCPLAGNSSCYGSTRQVEHVPVSLLPCRYSTARFVSFPKFFGIGPAHGTARHGMKEMSKDDSERVSRTQFAWTVVAHRCKSLFCLCLAVYTSVVVFGWAREGLFGWETHDEALRVALMQSIEKWVSSRVMQSQHGNRLVPSRWVRSL